MAEVTDNMTIILPCAGSASRLGIRDPKELFEILPGIRLIDFSLAHIRYAMSAVPGGLFSDRMKICVVVRPGKECVWEYVRSRMMPVSVKLVYFDGRYREWPGSVFSAADHASRKNVVLLPDTCMCYSEPGYVRDANGGGILKAMAGRLDRHDLVLGVVPCLNRRILAEMGAVRIEPDDRISRFEDKPVTGYDKFNAFWGCFGFTKPVFSKLHDFLAASVRKDPVDIRMQPFHPVAGIRMSYHRDLGTWSSISKFLQNHPKSDSWVAWTLRKNGSFIDGYRL